MGRSQVIRRGGGWGHSQVIGQGLVGDAAMS